MVWTRGWKDQAKKEKKRERTHEYRQYVVIEVGRRVGGDGRGHGGIKGNEKNTIKKIL